MIRFLLLVASALSLSCAPTITTAAASRPSAATKITWPKWKPTGLGELTLNFSGGKIVSYGSRKNSSEDFLVLSERRETPPKNIGAIPIAFLPTSFLAGKSPLDDEMNTLSGPGENSHTYPSLNYRSTFFQVLPATTTKEKTKGTIVYHTSMMMFSTAEVSLVKRFRKRGWNVLVALPSDSFYRSRLPVYMTPKENPAAAATYLAHDMDLHHAEQAEAARIALAYLRIRYPSWFKGRQILMGLSTGSFSLPAVALRNPNTWEKIIFISPGANLMTTYEKGAANIFPQTLSFIDTIRSKPPEAVSRIPTNEEYHELYRRAAKMTRLHPGALAPQLRGQEILFLNGTQDRILPKEEIEEIYHALGRPERWTYPLGHHLIALNLLTQVDRLEQWMIKD